MLLGRTRQGLDSPNKEYHIGWKSINFQAKKHPRRGTRARASDSYAGTAGLVLLSGSEASQPKFANSYASFFLNAIKPAPPSNRAKLEGSGSDVVTPVNSISYKPRSGAKGLVKAFPSQPMTGLPPPIVESGPARSVDAPIVKMYCAVPIEGSPLLYG
jgi:hypothetical protein